MKQTKLINLLSMAQRAGAVISGDFMVERTLKRKGGLPLLFLASDTAGNNTEKYQFLSEEYKTPVCTLLTKEELGKAIGKESRVVAAIMDPGFAKALLKIIME